MKKKSINIKNITQISIFIALTSILSQISIPLPFTPVPVNLALLSVFICGGIFNIKYAIITQITYLLIGAIGIPVFASMGSGFGIIFGPTGGYVVGYITCVLLVSLLKNCFKNKLLSLSIAMTLGLLSCYLLGTLWFMFITKNDLLQSLTLCVFPFILGDIIKIIISILIVLKLNIITIQSK